jgi:hypothetical protein
MDPSSKISILECLGNIDPQVYIGNMSAIVEMLELCMENVIWFKQIRVITKLPNSEQSYKGKVKTHNYINRQNQSIHCSNYSIYEVMTVVSVSNSRKSC